MIRVIVSRDDGELSITVKGHARDPIVCACVSTIMQGAVAQLKMIEGRHPEGIVVEHHAGRTAALP